MSKSKNPPGLRERDGHWHYRFNLHGHEYTGSTDLAATLRNVPAAQQAKHNERARLLGGGMPLRATKAFSDAVAQFIEWHKGEAKASTARRTQTSMVSAKLFFAHEPLRNLTPGRIEAYKTWRRSIGTKGVTIRHDLHNLSLFFQFTIKHGWLASNPIETVDIPSDRDAVREHIFTPAEEATYFGACLEGSSIYDLCRLIRLQGCRPEELMKLAKADVDLINHELHICCGKSKAAKRTLHLLPESERILAARLNTLGPWIFQGRHSPDL